MSSPADPGAPEALFVPHEGGWAPTELSRGPWDPGSLHGGPVAALMVRELERIEAAGSLRLARVTVELLRPVTLEPLLLTSSVVRPGRKIDLLDAELRLASDGTRVALARGLRIREAEVDFPDPGDDEVPEMPAESDTPVGMLPGAPIAFHSHGVEHRFLRGRFGVPGPMFDWTRLTVPVVPGEEPTPWQRAVAVADFGNGLSSLVPFDGKSLFVNPDLTVHLFREPVGEWIGLDASTRSSPSGIGLAETDIWDRSGRLGRGLQSLYLERF